MGEAKKVEGFRKHLSLVAWRAVSEVYQPGLVRVELQPVLFQPLAENRIHPICIVFVFEYHHKVIAVPHQRALALQSRDHLCAVPLIQHVVKKDVCQAR